MIISILALATITVLTIVDTIRLIKAKKMMKVSIDNCFKAIEKKEGR